MGVFIHSSKFCKSKSIYLKVILTFFIYFYYIYIYIYIYIQYIYSIGKVTLEM